MYPEDKCFSQTELYRIPERLIEDLMRHTEGALLRQALTAGLSLSAQYRSERDDDPDSLDRRPPSDAASE